MLSAQYLKLYTLSVTVLVLPSPLVILRRDHDFKFPENGISVECYARKGISLIFENVYPKCPEIKNVLGWGHLSQKIVNCVLLGFWLPWTTHTVQKSTAPNFLAPKKRSFWPKSIYVSVFGQICIIFGLIFILFLCLPFSIPKVPLFAHLFGLFGLSSSKKIWPLATSVAYLTTQIWPHCHNGSKNWPKTPKLANYVRATHLFTVFL